MESPKIRSPNDVIGVCSHALSIPLAVLSQLDLPAFSSKDPTNQEEVTLTPHRHADPKALILPLRVVRHFLLIVICQAAAARPVVAP